jgi:hypothetical protein
LPRRDVKLPDLLVTLAGCPKTRSVRVRDRCKAMYEGLRVSATNALALLDDAPTSRDASAATSRTITSLQLSPGPRR